MGRHAGATSWQKCNTHDLASTDAAGALRGDRMTLGARLKLVRGATSQKAFAAELRIHENTVSNAERRDSATQEYLLKLAEARKRTPMPGA